MHRCIEGSAVGPDSFLADRILSVAPLVQHVVCLSVCLSSVTFCILQSDWTDLYEIFRDSVD